MGNTKYFLLSSTGANFTDFGLNYEGVSLTGEKISFVGSTKVDALFLRPGITVNFTTSGAGADKIYLSGNFSDYTSSLSGSVMTLQRGSDTSLESVSVIKGTTLEASDVLVFGDGTLSSYDLYNKLKNGVVLPALNTAETSKAPLVPAAPNSPLEASIKAFALNPSGDTFAVMKPGVALTAVGSLGTDNIYVADGTTVDATLLGGGQDNIYLRGKWADYSKSVSGSAITFTRTVDGKTESVKVIGGTGALNDKLYFADGSVSSNDAKSALKLDLTSPITAVAGFDPSKVTPGLGPTLTASVLDNVGNLDVTSNLVLNYSEGVSAVAGKYIHIVNDGGTGFRGENSTNTLDILVTDTSQVTISGGKITINPSADLDLANNYHVTIDAGAFVGTSSQLATAAFDGTTALNFSTVTPGTSSVANAVQSQAMDASGALVSSYKWLDIENIGSPSDTAGTAQDLSTGKIALVTKDYEPAGGNASGYDGVGTGNFYVEANNFGADDLLYIDNQSASANDLSKTILLDDGTPPTTLQFAPGVTGGLGGFVDISLAGSTATFDSVAAMKSALGTSHDPVYSDSGVPSTTPPSDTTPPTLATSTPADDATTVAPGSKIVLTFSESIKAGSGDIVISNGTDTRTISVTDSSQVTISGNTVTIKPTADLTAGSSYNVQIASGVLTDQAGNAYAGISSATTLNFSTAAAVSTVTKINWIADQSSRILAAGEDSIEVQVHFTNPVVVNGAPKLQLTLVDDAGASKTVYASFQAYSGMASGTPQTSMLFVYELQAGDQGRYHIGSVDLNGGGITEASWVGSLAADLKLSSQNTTITAGGYVYASLNAGTTGTSGNDLLAPYEANPALSPTNGVFSSVTGEAGSRDVLGVPVLLPASVTTLEQANQYSLKYNASAGQIEVWAAGASAATASVTAPAPANYPAGVEGLIYHLMYQDASGQYQYTDTGDLTLYNSVTTYQDPVDANDRFIQGSMLADAIDLSSDTSSTTRYLVRGSTGNDTITGHAGRDAIHGEGGNDSIDAGDGNDRVFVGGGTDTVSGGEGNDKLVLTLSGQMMGLEPRLSGPLLSGLTGNWTDTGFVPTGSTPAYRLSVDDSGALKVRDYSNSNNVTLASKFEVLELHLSDSDQRFTVQLQYGSSGNDTITASATDLSAVMGLGGDDTLGASSMGNALLGGSGNDTLLGNVAADMLYGGAGDDSITGGDGDDFLVGDAGNDTLDGGAGSDSAGFVVKGSGTAPLLTHFYDSVRQAVIVHQGATELAQISLNQDGSWTVQDLTASGDGYTSFDVDVVSNIETLIFDYSGNTSGVYLTLTESALYEIFSNALSDTTAPDYLGSSVSGNIVTLKFYEPLAGNLLPASSTFKVSVNGVHTAVTAVSVNNPDDYDEGHVSLTLATPVVAGDLVTVGYTDPSSGNDAQAIQDLAGNDVSSFTSQRIPNLTADARGPQLQSAIISDNYITLHFDKPLDESNWLSTSAFSVKLGATELSVSNAYADGNQVNLYLSDTIDIGATVSLTYTDLTTDNDSEYVIQDWAGNDAGNLSLQLTNAPLFVFGRPVQSASDPTAFTSEIRIANGYDVAAYQVQAAVSSGSGVTYSYQSAAPDGWLNTNGSGGIAAMTTDYYGLNTDYSGTLIGWVTADFSTTPASAFYFKGIGLELTSSDAISLLGSTTYQSLAWTPGTAVDSRAPHITIDYADEQAMGYGVGIRIDLSEPAVGFDLADIVVTGGTMENFLSDDGLTYTATFVPQPDFFGNAKISVAAGAFTDLAGNTNSASVPLSTPIDALMPRVNSASFVEDKTNTTLSIKFSEPVFVNQMSAISVAKVSTSDDGYGGIGYQFTTLTTSNSQVNNSLVTTQLNNSSPLGAGDVLRLQLPDGLTDSDGYPTKTQEVFVGGSGNSLIDLSYYGSDSLIMLRGNAGDDTLIGTHGSDTLIDGKGADSLEGGRAGDVIRLVETVSTGYSRDIVHVGLGDSRAGFKSATDFVGYSSSTPVGSGFDTFSADISQHDVLDLPSAAIASNASHVAGTLSAGTIVKHSIASGVVTFEDAGNGAIAINGSNVADAVKYLASNLKSPGATVAFKLDADNNDSIESLYLFQDTGTMPVNGVQTALTDIGLRIEYADAAQLANVVLGNSAGANVLQLQDSTAPEPIGMELTSNGIKFYFSESVTRPSSPMMTLQKNGGTVYNLTSTDASGATLTFNGSGLSLAATDWALFTYQGQDSNTALKDAAGNTLIADISGIAFGGSDNNTINLSSYEWPEGADIEGMGGNDTITGTAYDDWISGGVGADKLSSGSVDDYDEFGFEQGDSPAITGLNLGGDSQLGNGDTFSFANGVDQIMDFSYGDSVYLEARNGWLNGTEGLGEMSDFPLSWTYYYPADGLVSDQGFFLVQGGYNATSKVFTVNDSTGADTLIVYDGDSSAGMSQTGLVLMGVVNPWVEGNSIQG